MAKTRRAYAPEFRRQMVDLVRAGRSPEELAGEFEPTAQSIRNWVSQSARNAGRGDGGLTTAERDELHRLRRENRQLRLEREILSNACPGLDPGRRPGSQYTSIEFGHRCREAGVRPSMGSVRDAYDDAMCESFFATLECELLDRRRFKTQAEARIAVFEFVEGFYNRRRRHSSIGYLSPIDYERLHAANPDAHQPAVVLAAVKDKPSGRPPSGAVLDRRCARRPHHRADRDGRMAPPGT